MEGTRHVIMVRSYLGKENRVYVRVVLEPLQNSHSLHLASATMDIRFSKFFCIGLEFDDMQSKASKMLHKRAAPHL